MRPVELPGAMLVGALPDARFAVTTVHLVPGDALLLYTDGLSEARDTDGRLLDTEGVAAMLTARTDPTTATTVVADTVAFLTGLAHGVDDDVALLALSVPTTVPASDTTATAAVSVAAAPGPNSLAAREH